MHEVSKRSPCQCTCAGTWVAGSQDGERQELRGKCEQINFQAQGGTRETMQIRHLNSSDSNNSHITPCSWRIFRGHTLRSTLHWAGLSTFTRGQWAQLPLPYAIFRDTMLPVEQHYHWPSSTKSQTMQAYKAISETQIRKAFMTASQTSGCAEACTFHIWGRR